MNFKRSPSNIVDTLEQKAPLIGVVLFAAFVFYALFKVFIGPSEEAQKYEQDLPEKNVPRPQIDSEKVPPPARLYVRPPAVRTAPVYGISEDIPTRSEMTLLVESLGFEGPFETLDDTVHGQVFRWVAGERTLTMPKDRRSFELYHNFPLEFLEENNAPLPGEDTAKEKADAFLESKGLLSDFLKSARVSVRPLKIGIQEKEEVPWSDADVVEVVYRVYLDEKPLFIGREPTLEAVSLWFGPGGEVLQLRYNFLGRIEDDLGEYPLKSAEEVTESLEKQEAFVLQYVAEGKYEVPPSIEDLESVTVRDIQLVYFKKRQTQDYLQPMFMIEADSNMGGIDVEIILLLPAVSDDFLE